MPDYVVMYIIHVLRVYEFIRCTLCEPLYMIKSLYSTSPKIFSIHPKNIWFFSLVVRPPWCKVPAIMATTCIVNVLMLQLNLQISLDSWKWFSTRKTVGRYCTTSAGMKSLFTQAQLTRDRSHVLPETASWHQISACPVLNVS